MKKLILISFILIFGVSTFAQGADTTKLKEEEETTVRFNDKTVKISENENGDTDIKIKKRKRRRKDSGWDDWDHRRYDNWDWDWDNDLEVNRRGRFSGHWSGFEAGLNNFMNKNFSMSRETGVDDFMDLNTSKSWNFNINAFQFSQRLIGRNFGLVTGIGIEWNSYRFDKDQTIRENADGVIEADPDTYIAVDVEKSKLVTTYITVPLLFELQSRGRTEVYINAGVIGGMKTGSYTKVVYEENGDKEKNKKKDDYNLTSFRYGVTARIGIDQLYVYGTYYFSPLFEKNKGPELYPISIGFGLSFN